MMLSGPWALLEGIKDAKLDYGVAALPGVQRQTHQDRLSGPDLWVLFDHDDANTGPAPPAPSSSG